MPWSKWVGCIVCKVTPVCERCFSRVCTIGAGPLRSGNMDGCTFRPRYVAPFRILAGTRRPNETATTRSIDVGGDQPLNVSIWCKLSPNCVATLLIGTGQSQWSFISIVSDPSISPSWTFLRPLPTYLSGRQTISILAIFCGLYS